jgi:hypothetical protein
MLVSGVIPQEWRRWMPFRRRVSTEDQAACDRRLACAKRQLQAGVMVSRPWPFETMVMAVLLEHEKRIEEMVKKREELGAGQRVI